MSVFGAVAVVLAVLAALIAHLAYDGNEFHTFEATPLPCKTVAGVYGAEDVVRSSSSSSFTNNTASPHQFLNVISPTPTGAPPRRHAADGL